MEDRCVHVVSTNSNLSTINSKTNVGSLITAYSDSVTIISYNLYKYGNRCYGWLNFTVDGDDLRNVNLFNIDESIKPIIQFCTFGINEVTGNAYIFSTQSNMIIRSASVNANDNYTAGQKVIIMFDWYTN